ncbi:MAG: MgtC/SapB family protein [Candidatus Pacebacteria bacterium]|nr:MgtC/SapB family protein [Candidatus Paceibacterota bacterium]
MLDILNFFDPLTLKFLTGLFMAIILGTLIGIERELRGKDAGISTNVFVICGAMLFTFMSMTVDPSSESRIAAQIVSGIGFLGAGLILKEGATIRNLTTAAGIWFAGAIGMAIGFGFYEIAVVATLASIAIPRIPHIKTGKEVFVEKKFTRSNKKKQDDDPVGAPTYDD